MARKVNYLNNKDMLLEIHRSKITFCSFVDTDYATYDIILPTVSKVNTRTVAEAKKNRAKKMTNEIYEHQGLCFQRKALLKQKIKHIFLFFLKFHKRAFAPQGRHQKLK